MRPIVQRLLENVRECVLDLAATARFREDVLRPLLSEQINTFQELSVQEGPSVTRLGFWVLGPDVLGRDMFLTWDRRILEIGTELREYFRVIVISPEDYLATVG